MILSGLGFIFALVLLSCSQESRHTQAAKNSKSILLNDKSIRIIAFGDFGSATSDFRRTMDMYHSKNFDPDYVFLLGDNTYSPIRNPADYRKHFNLVAGKCAAPHFAILGNYDYQYNAKDFMIKQMHQIDSRWNMPAQYYFREFKKTGVNVCVWFIDTELLLTTKNSKELRKDPAQKHKQLTWLDESLGSKNSRCTWKIVAGHIPTQMQASSPNKGSWLVENAVQPLLEKHNVDMYLSGHHHNTQHLVHSTKRINYFIIGQVSHRHGFAAKPPPNKAGNLVWGDGNAPAILELNIDAKRIAYAIHSPSQANGTPVHSGVIERGP